MLLVGRPHVQPTKVAATRAALLAFSSGLTRYSRRWLGALFRRAVEPPKDGPALVLGRTAALPFMFFRGVESLAVMFSADASSSYSPSLVSSSTSGHSDYRRD